MWGVILGIALCNTVALIWRTQAVKLIEPTAVSCWMSTEIIFGYTMQFIMLSLPPNMLTVIGAALVITGAVLISLETTLVLKFPESMQKWL